METINIFIYFFMLNIFLTSLITNAYGFMYLFGFYFYYNKFDHLLWLLKLYGFLFKYSVLINFLFVFDVFYRQINLQILGFMLICFKSFLIFAFKYILGIEVQEGLKLQKYSNKNMKRKFVGSE